jgi:hypothetical protein
MALGQKRQQTHRWFAKGKGRPTGKSVLLAHRWLEKHFGKAVDFLPSLKELIAVTHLLFRDERCPAALAKHCGVATAEASRYFGPSSRRTQPDGEVTLRAYDWVQRLFLAANRLVVKQGMHLDRSWCFVVEVGRLAKRLDDRRLRRLSRGQPQRLQEFETAKRLETQRFLKKMKMKMIPGQRENAPPHALAIFDPRTHRFVAKRKPSNRTRGV